MPPEHREQVSRNFHRDEFACKCGCGFDAVDEKLLRGLQRLRDLLGKPIKINSACRCRAHNADVGGSPKSQHLFGKAADIVVHKITPEYVAEFAGRMAEFSNSGIGLYDTFTHLDVRKGKSRWDYRTNQ